MQESVEESRRRVKPVIPIVAPPSVSRRIDAVDGLRGIAILAVLLYHIKSFLIPAGAEPGVFDFGWAGVDLFFVLSGFLITGILWDSRERSNYFRVFYTRRTLRIFPLYFLVLFLIFVGGPLALRLIHRPDMIQGLIHPETQAFAWLYILNVAMAFSIPVTRLLGHFWSLSIEEQFYLMWPLVIRNISRRRLMLICAGMIAIAPALRVEFYIHQLGFAAYALTICRMDSLAIGAAVALANRSRQDWEVLVRLAPVLTALGAVSVGIVALFAPAFSGVWMRTVGISSFGFMFGGCLTLAVHFGPPFLEQPILRFFGKYSYCLYCVHQPVIHLLLTAGIGFNKALQLIHRPWLAALSVNAAIILVCVAIAYASWHVFEKHFLRLKDAVH